jgi:hypothetical protein
VVGVLVATICFARRNHHSIGNLRVDHSDDRPYLFLELNTGVDEIAKQKTVLLNVKVEDFVPHK